MTARRSVGRYELHDEIAAGGMATVFLARLRGEAAFSRVVAIKMLHAQYARQEAFRAMFLDEARLVSRIRHPHVVDTLDVLQADDELCLVMDYVHGESLARLLRLADSPAAGMPLPIACAVFVGVLEGLHAAHEATAEDGTPLGIVHRDVSPQNVLVGVDGIARVADFGVAKAVGRLADKFSAHNTVKGKAGYMAPEQIRGRVDRRADLYATGVMLWEALAGERLFTGDSFLEIVTKSLDAEVPPPRARRPDVPTELDGVVCRALARDPSARFATALEMALALERAVPKAGAREVGAWVRQGAAESLDWRKAMIARMERGGSYAPASASEIEPERTGVDTIAGVAPPLATPARPRRAALLWVALAALGVIGSATAVLWRHGPAIGANAVASPAGSISLSTGAALAPADTAVSSPSSAEAPPASAIASSTDSPRVTTVASIGARPALTPNSHSAPHPSATIAVAPPSSKPASSCHWEQLPDEQGILIPKKVCP